MILRQKLTVAEEKAMQLTKSIKEAKQAVSKKKEPYYKQRVQDIRVKSSDQVCRNLYIFCQIGVSSWLSALPLQELR